MEYITDQIKNTFKDEENTKNYKNYDDICNLLQNKAIEVNQDWDAETTTYIFEDGSKIEDCNGFLTILAK